MGKGVEIPKTVLIVHLKYQGNALLGERHVLSSRKEHLHFKATFQFIDFIADLSVSRTPTFLSCWGAAPPCPWLCHLIEWRCKQWKCNEWKCKEWRCRLPVVTKNTKTESSRSRNCNNNIENFDNQSK